MTQIVDKKLKLMCDYCKSHFDKPCAWLSLGNEYCTEIMEIQKELEQKDKEIERLKNELSIKTTYIEDLLKSILKSTDIKIQREVYEHGIEYDRKLKELKEGKECQQMK